MQQTDMGKCVNLTNEQLLETSLANNEGKLSADGVLTVETGKRTGRSPKDRYIVRDAMTADQVDWGTVNQPFDAEHFDMLWDKAQAYLADKETYESHLQVGADPIHHLRVHVRTQYAWHSLFVRNLFIRGVEGEADPEKSWSILSAPGLVLDPAEAHINGDGCVILNFTLRRVLLCGMRYAGEMKKAMFTALNFALPQVNVLPMHCAANVNAHGEVALFFGLSGTGKTTLSADPDRLLIGDDEHGWSESGVFNFEGGCYAKCINLTREREPVIWDAIRPGAVMENVVLDADAKPDFTDDSLTKNSRAAYPLEHIPVRVESSRAGHPTAVIFLCCDLYGVLPPVAHLTREQAAYYFLSGYTALMGSTEVGSAAEIQPTFSTCFGAPFFPRAPRVYADLLMRRVDETGAKVYLVNTGWTGGGFGSGGERFSIAATRSIVHAITEGRIDSQSLETVPHFGFAVPTDVPGVDASLLHPKATWDDPEAYDAAARTLIEKFIENFKRFDVHQDIANAGPTLD